MGREQGQPAPSPAADRGPGGEVAGEELSEEELARELAEVQRQLLETPAAVVVANHCIGLFQLAVLHLSQETPDLAEARLAIDALAAVVDGLGSRLGDQEQPLRDAVAQLRLGFVQRQGPAPSAPGSG